LIRVERDALLPAAVSYGTLDAFNSLSGAEPAHLRGGIGRAVYITVWPSCSARGCRHAVGSTDRHTPGIGALVEMALRGVRRRR
jgi:hypothetical protein